jgi:hypothetical protein
MSISLYDISVGSYLQIVGAFEGVLAKGLEHFKANGIDPNEIVESRMIADMLPFKFQVAAVAQHSLGAIKGIQGGVFTPPSEIPSDYAGLQKLIADTHAGLKALASLRMEKGYRDYGHDIDNTDSVLEAGLGFAVDLKKPGGFIGRDAVLRKKAEGPLKRRLVQVLCKDPQPLMFHAEPVWRDGVRVGYVRAASYGHTLGGAVGLAMIEGGNSVVDAAFLGTGTWEVEIAARRYPALASMRPLFDPDNAKIKA